MVDNLIQFGVQFDVLDDSMEFQSTGVKIPKCVVNTFGDHRIAMAFSILATVCQVFMNDPFVVRKSFSGYWSEFEKLSGVYPKKVSEQR